MKTRTKLLIESFRLRRVGYLPRAHVAARQRVAADHRYDRRKHIAPRAALVSVEIGLTGYRGELAALAQRVLEATAPAGVCQRSACGVPLNRGHYRIYNVPSVEDGSRVYCPACGRGIVEANPGIGYKRINRFGEAIIEYGITIEGHPAQ